VVESISLRNRSTRALSESALSETSEATFSTVEDSEPVLSAAVFTIDCQRRHLLLPLGRFRDVAGDFLGCGILLGHRGGDPGGRAVDRVQLGDDVRDRVRRGAGDVLHRLKLAADLFGGPGAAIGQRLHLVGDDGEALAGLAGAGRLDGRVERQQVGVVGDLADNVEDAADALGGPAETLTISAALAPSFAATSALAAASLT